MPSLTARHLHYVETQVCFFFTLSCLYSSLVAGKITETCAKMLEKLVVMVGKTRPQLLYFS